MSAPQTFSPDDALPPVEPPSARFLVQLFVIPGVIVLILVLGYIGCTSITDESGDPRLYLEHLRSDSPKRWYAAIYLAGALGEDRNAELRGDREYMGAIAKELEEEIAAGDASVGRDRDMEEYVVRFRACLCRALGHFRVATGVPALLKAATTQNFPYEVEVRLSALEGLAQLTNNIRQPVSDKLLPQSAALARKLAEAARGTKDGQELAAALEKFADEATALAARGKESPDLGARSIALASQAAPLVDRAAATILAIEGQDAVTEFRATIAQLAQQAREAKEVDWAASSPLAKAALDAAVLRTDAKRFDKQLDREAEYGYKIRARGAYLLGVLGGDEAIARLTDLLGDPRRSVAYDAATALCRQGVTSPKVLETLAEMIAEPEVEIEEPKQGFNETTRRRIVEHDRRVIVANGMRGVQLLAKRDPQGDLSRVMPAIERVIETGEDSPLRADARTLLEDLKTRK